MRLNLQNCRSVTFDRKKGHYVPHAKDGEDAAGWAADLENDWRSRKREWLEQELAAFKAAAVRNLLNPAGILHMRKLEKILSEDATAECQHCGEPFTSERRTKRFCTAKCRVYWNRAKERELRQK